MPEIHSSSIAEFLIHPRNIECRHSMRASLKFDCLVLVILYSVLCGTDGFAATNNIDSIRVALQEIKDVEHRDPNVDDLLQVIDRKQLSVGIGQVSDAFSVLESLAKPPITATQLLDLYSTKIGSIGTADISWRVDRNGSKSPEGYSGPQFCRFVKSGDKLFFTESYPEESKRIPHVGDSYKSDYAYDGNVLNVFPWGGTTGEVRNLSHRRNFFPLTNVLQLAMLTDPSYTGKLGDSGWFDLAYILKGRSIQYEGVCPESKNPCLIVDNGTLRIYLATAMDLSVVRFEFFRFIESPRLTRRLESYREFHDLKQYDSGIWLPNRLEVVTRDGSPKRTHETITITKASINKAVDEHIFSNVFPAGTKVADHVRDQVYVVGRGGSIATTVQDSLREAGAFERSGNWASAKIRIWSIATNAIVALVLLVLLLRRRHSSA